MEAIKSKTIEFVAINQIIPNPKNANRHSIEQIKRLEKLIEYQGFRNPLVVSNRTGFLIAGHGRLEAATNLGMEELPVIRQDFDDEAQEYAYLISDNEIARWAELDEHLLHTELKDLKIDDLELLGIEDFVTSDLIDDENQYTRKIETPIYEPTGDKPKLRELFDTTKADELSRDIEESNASSEVKAFLMLASKRHIKFNYKNIAEYYAHASNEDQSLMEKSALVVIDFEKAIENGFVEMTKSIRENYLNG